MMNDQLEKYRDTNGVGCGRMVVGVVGGFVSGLFINFLTRHDSALADVLTVAVTSAMGGVLIPFVGGVLDKLSVK